jgi:hypothetical protein
MVDEKLRQLFHIYHTNAVEGFNKYLTKFLHKDKTFCQTIENGTRSYLAAGLQSIGFRQFYARVFELTGLESTEDDMTSLFFRSEDKDKLFRMEYRQKLNVKKDRQTKQYAMIKKGVEDLRKENAKSLSYNTGMMGPGGQQEEGGAGGAKKRKKRAPQPCGHCGSLEHSKENQAGLVRTTQNSKSEVSFTCVVTCELVLLSK